jgi:hypothetical protein
MIETADRRIVAWRVGFDIMSYPLSLRIEPALTARNRLTTAFRLILAIPHLILVGGAGFGFSYSGDGETSAGAEGGLIGAVVVVLAIVSWFTILFAGTHLLEIRQLTSFYMRWRARALAYVMLLEDAYPPFGDAAYPASLDIVTPPGPRNRLTVAVRVFLALPHIFVLVFVLIAWHVITIVAWFAILLTGRYPRGLYGLSVGFLRWRLRVDAYLLLLVDDYPPFSLQ